MSRKRGTRMREKEWNGNAIRALRELFDETQEEFAERAGVAVGSLRFWEQDQGPPSLTTQRLFVYLEADTAAQEVSRTARASRRKSLASA
jgi:DNA-binding transcriptional regulator YiaG